MTGDVFVDSGAFIAFLVRADQHHAEVRSLFARPPRRAYTSILVVSETYSWFVHRLGEEAARTFRRLTRSVPWLSVLGGSASHMETVWQTLDEFRGAKLTFVDASSIAILADRNIGVVWGTDHHLALSGARVIPGSG